MPARTVALTFGGLALGLLIWAVGPGLETGRFSWVWGGIVVQGAPRQLFVDHVLHAGYAMYPWGPVALVAAIWPVLGWASSDAGKSGSRITGSRINGFGKADTGLATRDDNPGIKGTNDSKDSSDSIAGWLWSGILMLCLGGFGAARDLFVGGTTFAGLAPGAVGIIYLWWGGRLGRPAALVLALLVFLVARDISVHPEVLLSLNFGASLAWAGSKGFGSIFFGVGLLAAGLVLFRFWDFLDGASVRDRGRATHKMAGPRRFWAKASPLWSWATDLVAQAQKWSVAGAGGISVAAAVVMAFVALPDASRNLSLKPVVDMLEDHRVTADSLGVMGGATRGLGFYLGRPAKPLDDVRGLVAHLASKEAVRFALVPASELGAIHRAFATGRSPFFPVEPARSPCAVVEQPADGR